jgi:hypothetical protein
MWAGTDTLRQVVAGVVTGVVFWVQLGHRSGVGRAMQP